MELILTDLLIILGLIFVNGFFSGSEIALISVKRTRLISLAENKDGRARTLLNLKTDPDRLFATVQIGVTLVGTLASVYGGARFLGHLKPYLSNQDVPFIGPYLEQIALVVLVISISYMTLVFGELIPKSIAHRYAERVSLLVAYPLNFFSRIFSLFTVLLTFSSNLVLKLFKDRTSFSETKLQEEEIRQLLREGLQAGTIERSEHEMISNVFDINDTSAREIMVPRVDMKMLNLKNPDDAGRLLDFPFSRIPVYEDSKDHILGILHIRDYMRMVAKDMRRSLRDLIMPAYFVPESMKIDKIMKEMQTRRTQMAIVVDEYGVTAGLLTLEDILEEIVGDINDDPDNSDEANTHIRSMNSEEGVFYVAGSCPIADFNEYFGKLIPESDSYNSVAGFVIEVNGRFPEVGETTQLGPHTFELIKRVRQQLVTFRFQTSREESPPEQEHEEAQYGQNPPQ
ncbi:MAG: HlyC/CorC family transporter [Leptospiraceae bacterium]|nr:HlyC/CorC family transporter [Leptospiraceae bacterium]